MKNELMKIAILAFQCVSNEIILKEASIINPGQRRLIVICFWTFTIRYSCMDTTKYCTFQFSQRYPEITIYKYIETPGFDQAL